MRRTQAWIIMAGLAMVFADSLVCRAEEHLNVGVYNFRPLVFLDQKDGAQGLFIDILNHIAQAEAWQVTYIPGSWHECLTRLEQGEIDLLVNVAYSAERAQKFDFTRLHLFVLWAEVYTRPGTMIRSLLDLQGKIVGTLKDAQSNGEFQTLLDQFGVACRITEYLEYADLLYALRNGETDASIFPNVFAMQSQEVQRLNRTQILFAPTKVHIAVKKGRHQHILSVLDRHFAAFNADQRLLYDRFFDKWLGTPPKIVIFPGWLLWGFGMFLASSGMLFVFSLILNRRVAQKTAQLTRLNQELSASQTSLRESEEQYRRIVETALEGIWLIDLQGKTLFVNQRMADMLGYTVAEIRAIPVFHFVDTQQHQEAHSSLQRRQQGVGEIVERCLIRKDGGRLWVLNSTSPIRDQQGQIIGSMGMLTDITERKQAEEELKQYQQIVSSTPDAIALIDLEFRYKIVNAAYERFSNIRCEQLMGQTVAEYLGKNISQQYIKPHFDRCLRGDTITFQEWFDYPTLGKRFVQVTYFPYRDAENNISGVVANTRDITEIKEVEEQLKATLREKEVLLREIHHRVKNNLMVVQSLIEMQSYQTTQAEALNLFRDLHNRVMAMSMVHEDLYHQSQNLAQIDFGRYVERLLINIRQGFAKARAAIKVVAEEIFLDVEQAIPCGLIVAELATNAFKYAFPTPPPPSPKGDTPPQPSPKGRELLPLLRGGPGGGSETGGEGAEIRVEMRKKDNSYTLIVSDNGAGLPPDLDYRQTTTLGLTLVRSWAMHQLKGKIEVDMQQGTRFIITFQARGL